MKKYSAPGSVLWELESADLPSGLKTEEYLDQSGDVDFIVAGAMAAIPANLI